MTQEENELLLSLLKKADSDGLLHVYDNEENTYEVTLVSLDNLDNKICIKIKSLLHKKKRKNYYTKICVQDCRMVLSAVVMMED